MDNASELSTINDMVVHKGDLGEVEKVPFNAWDYIHFCTGESCKISHLCTYEHSGKCGIERDYLKSVLEPFNAILTEEEDPILNQWLGLHLIPLYHDLIRIKKAKLIYDEVIMKEFGGGMKVNPLFGELRQQVRMIRQELRDSGIQKLLFSRGHIGGGVGVVDNDLKSYIYGEKGYYESMSSGQTQIDKD